MRLNALEKSSLRRTLLWAPSCRLVQARTVWIPVSAPDLMPTPSCVGQNVRRASSCTSCIRHLPVSRRRISPTAIGRTPPFGLGTATSPAPASTGAIKGQAWPCAIKFTRRAKWTTRLCVEPGAPASRRCWMRRPEGPGAVSAGKLRNARATTSSEISSASGREARSTAGCG